MGRAHKEKAKAKAQVKQAKGGSPDHADGAAAAPKSNPKGKAGKVRVKVPLKNSPAARVNGVRADPPPAA